jgi:hypothetical protein
MEIKGFSATTGGNIGAEMIMKFSIKNLNAQTTFEEWGRGRVQWNIVKAPSARLL